MRYGTVQSYTVFVRNWWRWEYGNASLVNDKGQITRRLVPDPSARKTTLAKGCTEDEARAICQEYNSTHKPGPLSRKAEYTSEGR